jgi:hypothetical protein
MTLHSRVPYALCIPIFRKQFDAIRAWRQTSCVARAGESAIHSCYHAIPEPFLTSGDTFAESADVSLSSIYVAPEGRVFDQWPLFSTRRHFVQAKLVEHDFTLQRMTK